MMTAIGRPRGFDRDAALDAAMIVFWRKGYLAASINDLCEAMGIRSPSLYAAFHSKEALYIEALGRYTTTVRPQLWDHLEDQPTARAGMHNLLLGAARGLRGCADVPSGCMVTLASAGEDSPEAIAEAVRNARLEGLELFRARLTAALDEGELPSATDVDRLSRFYLAVFQGMVIQARDGAARAELEDLAEMAMAAWPRAQKRSRLQT